MGLDVTGHWRYPPPNAAWLDRTHEPVLLPDLPIVDAHHHLWEEHEAPYFAEDLAADAASGHAVVATVFVQAHYGYRIDGPEALRPVGETERVIAQTTDYQSGPGRTRLAAAIVGYADLRLGDRVSEVIEAHLMAAPERFRGIRHSVSHDGLFPNGIVLRPAQPQLLADPAYREGLRSVARYGLSYDAMLYHGQIQELAAVAAAIPELTIVLDHAGCLLGVGPYERRAAELLPAWRRDMAELARHPNVRVKLGGLGMIICGARWHEREQPPSSIELAEAWHPQIETCIELFGADRCMFESNFPVDKAMYSYRTLWNAFKRLTASASDAERRSLFAGTAADIYRIDASAGPA